jgi:hypothetical protein
VFNVKNPTKIDTDYVVTTAMYRNPTGGYNALNSIPNNLRITVGLSTHIEAFKETRTSLLSSRPYVRSLYRACSLKQ